MGEDKDSRVRRETILAVVGVRGPRTGAESIADVIAT